MNPHGAAQLYLSVSGSHRTEREAEGAIAKSRHFSGFYTQNPQLFLAFTLRLLLSSSEHGVMVTQMELLLCQPRPKITCDRPATSNFLCRTFTNAPALRQI
jgi:hypothetical protein